MPKVVLTIGGSDSGGGAGIQADLKTISVLGLHGTCAITAITAQNTLGVQQVFGLEPDTINAQLNSITSDFSVAYAKTGMLDKAENVEIVAEHLRKAKLPFVLDPVIEAEAGGRLLRPEALNAIKERLIPLARVVTPNIFEAEALTGIRVRDIDSANLALHKILDLGPRAVIIKGGHLDCTDFLLEDEEVHHLPGKRVDGQNHGVGCTYSAALTSYLALDFSLKEAAKKAKRFSEESLRGGMQIGKGVGPVNQIAYLQEEANRFRVLCDMQKALDLIRDESGIFEIIPEQGSNLGMAIPGATFSGDIAALDGKLVKVGKEVRQSGCIRFGASSHLAHIILAAMSFDGKARAVMNLRLEALPDCIVEGLMTIKIDRNLKPSGKTSNNLRIGTFKDTASVLPDVIFDKDRMGKDHMYGLLGYSATQLAHKAVRFARLLRDGKI